MSAVGDNPDRQMFQSSQKQEMSQTSYTCCRGIKWMWDGKWSIGRRIEGLYETIRLGPALD